MNPRSLAFKLASWYAVLLSAAFTLVAAAMYPSHEKRALAGAGGAELSARVSAAKVAEKV